MKRLLQHNKKDIFRVAIASLLVGVVIGIIDALLDVFVLSPIGVTSLDAEFQTFFQRRFWIISFPFFGVLIWLLIKQRNAAQNKLKKVTSHRNLLLRNTLQPLYITDPAGQVIMANKYFKKLLKVDELDNLLERRVAGSRSDYKQDLDEFLDNGSIYKEDWTTVSGEQITFEILTTEINFKAQISNLHLVSVIGDNTVEIGDDGLVEPTLSKVSLIKHDLQNYIMILTNLVQLKIAKDVSPDAFNQLDDTISKMANLVANLPPNSGADEQSTECDVNRTIEEVANYYNFQGEKDIDVKLLLSKAMPPCIFSSFEFERVMVNLIKNSYDAIIRSGEITIETKEHNSINKPFMEINISDTGVGIKEENKSKLFEPFFTTKANGTGLGLVNVLKFVRRNKGTIEIRDNQPKGTVFHITFPVSVVY